MDYLTLTKSPATTKTSSAKLGGYKTFYDAKVNYEVDDNTTIYTAVVDGSKVTLTALAGKVIPAGKAVALKTSNTTDYKITLTPTIAASSDDFSDNELTVAAAAGTIANAYVLAASSKSPVGFYLFNGAFAAGDVYLPVTGAAPARLSIVEGDEATAIAGVGVAAETEDAAAYNVAGQRVGEGYKGIVIKGGKKYLNK